MTNAINFAEPDLVNKYGSWVRVQAKFYEFLFKHALDLSPEEFNRKYLEESNRVESENFCETSIRTIEQLLSTPEEAWKLFWRKEAYNTFLHELLKELLVQGTSLEGFEEFTHANNHFYGFDIPSCRYTFHLDPYIVHYSSFQELKEQAKHQAGHARKNFERVQKLQADQAKESLERVQNDL